MEVKPAESKELIGRLKVRCADEDGFVREFLLPEDLAEPDWASGGRVHNWRRHVGYFARTHWQTFTEQQRVALFLDAEDLASQEPWD